MVCTKFTNLQLNTFFFHRSTFHKSFVLQYLFYNCFIIPDDRILSKIHRKYGRWHIYLCVLQDRKQYTGCLKHYIFLVYFVHHSSDRGRIEKMNRFTTIFRNFWILGTLDNICFPTILLMTYVLTPSMSKHLLTYFLSKYSGT